MSRKVGWSAGLAKGKAGAEQRKKGEKTAFEVSYLLPSKWSEADISRSSFLQKTTLRMDSLRCSMEKASSQRRKKRREQDVEPMLWLYRKFGPSSR